MKIVTITQGDTARSFAADLTLAGVVPSDNVPTGVEFHMQSSAGLHIDRSAMLLAADAVKWSVSYTPASDDVSTPGDYSAQWRLTFANGKVQSFPDAEYIPIKIIPKIGT